MTLDGVNQTRMKTFTELQGGHVHGADTGVFRFASFFLLLNCPDAARMQPWSYTHKINMILTISSRAPKAERPAQLATHRTSHANAPSWRAKCVFSSVQSCRLRRNCAKKRKCGFVNISFSEMLYFSILMPVVQLRTT